MKLRGFIRLGVGLAIVASTMGGVVGSALAETKTRSSVATDLVVQRDGPDVLVPVWVCRTGEALLDVRATAPGTDWGTAGAEAAVLSVAVDSRPVTDVVVAGESQPNRKFAAGRLTQGRHVLRLRFANDSSAAAATKILVRSIAVTSPKVNDAILRHAPIVYGRSAAGTGGPYQNARSDTPLVAWYNARPADTLGHITIEYSMIWSNEDGGYGANVPALMAIWGRTTDIEWTYRLEIDETGQKVPGSDVYQAKDHQTLQFQGRYEGDHPVLRVCTDNNNLCDTVDPAAKMRFALAADQTSPAGYARERLMDVNGWTYPMMAKEMNREGKIEPPSPAAPYTPEVSDQRNWLYVAIDKRTSDPNAGPDNWVGVAIGVKLKSGETFLSNKGYPPGSLQRDEPAATTVELPAGTTADDIVAISAHRFAVGTDTGASIHVTALQRGLLLGQDYLPQPSFASWTGDVELTAAQPAAPIWTR